jgi:hypothetical protein
VSVWSNQGISVLLPLACISKRVMTALSPLLVIPVVMVSSALFLAAKFGKQKSRSGQIFLIVGFNAFTPSELDSLGFLFLGACEATHSQHSTLETAKQVCCSICHP